VGQSYSHPRLLRIENNGLSTFFYSKLTSFGVEHRGGDLDPPNGRFGCVKVLQVARCILSECNLLQTQVRHGKLQPHHLALTFLKVLLQSLQSPARIHFRFLFNSRHSVHEQWALLWVWLWGLRARGCLTSTGP
jgi:hypothetical protein